ncbi:sigma-70 family RNA polymerase sigma factor [Kibdelosporangium philippinense]|uniref:Sigma-70 family RNA polymerase sigma factor n=1 Tax=Kibdelosporangium philippinense TaxID=211113 RepID=A0ABS8Z349_9PSEU|nr:sigma-70 family RNA polymerase sigma factor [Kibdelosporangium philippinense]MCE7002354.1 sigma-70 family RNA polymerase sigma factor [Kibdelosporangium philippinense]
MSDDFEITPLVVAAAGGDQAAWGEIVSRFSPLLVSVIRGFRLTPSEIEDIAQEVWLRLVEHLGDLKEPRALPKWIITIARRVALRYVQRKRETQPLEPDWQQPADDDNADPATGLLRQERQEAVLAGLAELPAKHRELLLLLVADPPLSYVEIAKRLDLPVGSIGPTRARALERLRKTAAMGTYQGNDAGGDEHDAATLG